MPLDARAAGRSCAGFVVSEAVGDIEARLRVVRAGLLFGLGLESGYEVQVSDMQFAATVATEFGWCFICHVINPEIAH